MPTDRDPAHIWPDCRWHTCRWWSSLAHNCMLPATDGKRMGGPECETWEQNPSVLSYADFIAARDAMRQVSAARTHEPIFAIVHPDVMAAFMWATFRRRRPYPPIFLRHGKRIRPFPRPARTVITQDDERWFREFERTHPHLLPQQENET